MTEKTELSQKYSVSVGLPYEIVRIIDKKRGLIPRANYLRNLIIEVLEKDQEKGQPA